MLESISVPNCSAAESSLANPLGKLSPFLCQHSFTLLCNYSFAVLKLQQPHLLILTTMGLKFTLSLCALLKIRINPQTWLSLNGDHEVQTSYGQTNQRGKDLHFLGH